MWNKYAQFLRLLDDDPAAQDGGQPPAEGGDAGDGDKSGGEPPAGTKDTNGGDGEGGEPPADGDGGEPKDSGDGDGSDGGEDGSSDSYEEFELPEGMVMDEQALDSFTPLMKEAGLDQAQAQKMVDAYAQLKQAEMQAQNESFSQQQDEWYDQSQNDKEFGGDNWEQSEKLAVQAIEKFGTPELRQFLTDTGMGNHPELVRLMVRVGRAVSEDSPGEGGNSPQNKRDRTSILYPDS